MRALLFFFAAGLAAQTYLQQNYDVRAYAWSRTGPGAAGDLSVAGAGKILTLRPAPKGILFTASYPTRILLTGGTTEAALITATTCPLSGAANSCTVTVTTAYAHPAPWTAGSGSGGTAEAVNTAAAGGGTVTLQPGTLTLYATLYVPSNVRLVGQRSSVVELAANAWPATYTGPFYDSDAGMTAAIATVNNASGVEFRDFTIDMNGANQATPGNGTPLALVNTSDYVVSGLEIRNARMTGGAIDALGTGGSHGVITGNVIHGYGGTACAGGIFVQHHLVEVSENHADNLCDEAFIANGVTATDISFSHNTVDYNNPSFNSGTAFHSEGAARVSFTDNVCRGQVAVCYGATALNGNAGSVRFVGNLADQNSTGNAGACFLIVNSTAYLLSDILLVGNDANGCDGGGGLLIQNTSTGTLGWFSVSGNFFHNLVGAGIAFLGTGISGVSIVANQFHNNAGGDFSAPPAGTIVAGNQTDAAGALGFSGATVSFTSAPPAASDALLAAPAQTFHVTGTATISTIGAPAGLSLGGCLNLVPDGAWHLVTGGNIGANATAVVGKMMSVCTDTAGIWWPSYQ